MEFKPFTKDDRPTMANFNKKFESIIANPYLWNGQKKLKDLQTGDLLKLNEDGAPIKFIVLGKDHYGAGTGVTLMREKTFSRSPFNSGASYLSSMYAGCTLDNFCDGIWPLKLDDDVRECIVPVPIVVAEGDSVSTLHTIYRKAFALSCTEVGLSGWQTEGDMFDYFSTDERRIAYYNETGTAAHWGLRSPTSSAYVFYVNEYGTRSDNTVSASHFAPRPIFNLNPDMVIKTAIDSDGCHNLLANGE